MIAQPAFSFVPGMAIPGSARPGLAQITAGATQWPYKGPVTLYYLDYLDIATGHTLIAVPGVSYTMIAVNSRAGLTDPPPDGRWGGTETAITFRIAAPSAAQVRAARERALAAHGHYPGTECRHCDPAPRQTPAPLSAGALHGHYPGNACRQCDPAPAEPEPLIRRMPGPDFAPSPSMAMVRADLERARIAHGHYAPGGCRLCMSGGRKDEAVVV